MNAVVAGDEWAVDISRDQARPGAGSGTGLALITSSPDTDPSVTAAITLGGQHRL